MAGLPDLLAWLDNKRRVAGRNLSDLIQNPSGAVEQMDDRAKNYNQNVEPTIQGGQLYNRPLTEEEKKQQSIDMAMNFMGGGVGSIKGIVGAGRTAAPQYRGTKLTDEEIASRFWDALDNAGEGYIGLRGDNEVIKNSFRKSWNRPDGVKTTRLPGTSVIGLGADNITEESLLNAVKQARAYGKNIYMLEGEAPLHMQWMANDPGEKLLRSNKVLASVIESGDASALQRAPSEYRLKDLIGKE